VYIEVEFIHPDSKVSSVPYLVRQQCHRRGLDPK